MQSAAYWAWAGHVSQLSVLRQVAAAPSRQAQHILPSSRATNSPLLVQPGQTDSGGAERLVMPTKKITSKQAFIEIVRANSDIGHINLQSGRQ